MCCIPLAGTQAVQMADFWGSLRFMLHWESSTVRVLLYTACNNCRCMHACICLDA